MLWLVLIVFVLALVVGAAAAVRGGRRQQRIMRGCCPECGYDLRSTPHRCPECGHVPPHGVRLSYRDWLAVEMREAADLANADRTGSRPQGGQATPARTMNNDVGSAPRTARLERKEDTGKQEACPCHPG